VQQYDISDFSPDFEGMQNGADAPHDMLLR